MYFRDGKSAPYGLALSAAFGGTSPKGRGKRKKIIKQRR